MSETRAHSLSAPLVVGARFACDACRVRSVSERCPSCGGATIDLATSAGAAQLARWCRSRRHPSVRKDPFANPSKRVLSIIAVACAIAGAVIVAKWSIKHIDPHGFVPRDAVTALALLCGAIAGVLGSAITGVIVQLFVSAAGAFAWAVGSLALVRAQPDAHGRARGWHRPVLLARSAGRNLAIVPFGGRRRGASLEPLGPVLGVAVPKIGENGPTLEGEIVADELTALDDWQGAIVGVEGRTCDTDVCDASVVPFRVRTRDGDEVTVRVDAGVIRFADAPDAFACIDELPTAWGVCGWIAKNGPVNVWTAPIGSHVHVSGGRVAEDGAWIGDAQSAIEVVVSARAVDQSH